jgi:WD40 repeat protein
MLRLNVFLLACLVVCLSGLMAANSFGQDSHGNSLSRKVGPWEVTTLGKSAKGYPNGDRLLIVTDDTTPELWDTQFGKRVASLDVAPGKIKSVAFSCDGKKVMAAESPTSRLLFVWETVTGKLLKKINLEIDKFGLTWPWRPDWLTEDTILLQMDYRNGGTAVTAWSTLIVLVNLETGKVLNDYYYPVCLSWIPSPDHKRALQATLYWTRRDSEGSLPNLIPYGCPHLELFDLSSFKETARLYDYAHPGTTNVRNHVWSPDSRWIATDDGRVQLWDARTEKHVFTMEGHTSAILSICFSPDSRSVLTASDDKTARLWEVMTGKLRATLNGHTAGLNEAIYDKWGQHILTCAEDKTARLWDAATGKLLSTLDDHESGVRHVAFGNDGASIVTTTAKEIQRIWRINGGKATLETPVAGPGDAWFGELLLRRRGDVNELWSGPPGAKLPNGPIPNEWRILPAFSVI